MVFPFDKISIASAVRHSFVRFLNAAPKAGKIKIFVNGVDMHNDLDYNGLTGYDKAAEGGYLIKITCANGDFLEQEITVGAEKIYTVALSGDKEGLKLNVVEDKIREKKGENACVRFVNLSSMHEPAHIYMNRIHVLSDMGYADCSDYMTLTPGEYSIDVCLNNPGDEFLTVSNARFDCGKHYSAYLVGSSDNPRLLVPVEGSGYLRF